MKRSRRSVRAIRRGPFGSANQIPRQRHLPGLLLTPQRQEISIAFSTRLARASSETDPFRQGRLVCRRSAATVGYSDASASRTAITTASARLTPTARSRVSAIQSNREPLLLTLPALSRPRIRRLQPGLARLSLERPSRVSLLLSHHPRASQPTRRDFHRAAIVRIQRRRRDALGAVASPTRRRRARSSGCPASLLER